MEAKHPQKREAEAGFPLKKIKGQLRKAAIAETFFWCLLVIGAVLLAAKTQLPSDASFRLARIGLRHPGISFLVIGLIGQVAAAITLSLLADKAFKSCGEFKVIRALAVAGVFVSLCGLIASVLAFKETRGGKPNKVSDRR